MNDLINWIIDGTSASGLAVYCVGMGLILTCAAWAYRLDQQATSE
jgi:hypothetical protein